MSGYLWTLLLFGVIMLPCAQGVATGVTYNLWDRSPSPREILGVWGLLMLLCFLWLVSK